MSPRGRHLGLLAAIGALFGGGSPGSSVPSPDAERQPDPRSFSPVSPHWKGGSKRARRRREIREHPPVVGRGSQAVHRERRAKAGDDTARLSMMHLGEKVRS